MKKIILLIFILICSVSYSQWVQVMNGTASYSISGSGNYLFAGDSLYVARSSNNGLSWTTVFVQTYAYRNFVAFSGSTLINGVLSPFNSIGGIYQS